MNELKDQILEFLPEEKKFLHKIYSKFLEDHAYLWEEFEDLYKLRHILLVIIKLFYEEHKHLHDLSQIDQQEFNMAVRELIGNPDALLQKAREAQVKEFESLGLERWFEVFKGDIRTINLIIKRHFHQQRFEGKSQKHAERGFLKMVLDRNLKMNPLDFAHEEALRDNADFERRHTDEFREWKKQLKVVIENLKKKRDDPNGAGKEIRALLLILGGGMKGTYGAGQVIALGDMGFTEVFDKVVGISAGAADAAYFLGGREQARLGTSIYYEECTTPKFLNFRRLHRIMDVGYLTSEVLNEDGTKPLDTEAIRRNRSEFYVQVTDNETSEPVLLNVKTVKEGILEAIHASMALPVVYRKPVNIDGRDYVDGAFEPLPIEEVVRRFNPTDVLILPNCPFTDTDSFETSKGAYVLAELMGDRTSLALMKKVLRHKQQMREAFEYMKKTKGVNVGMMWPPDSDLNQVIQDPDQIKLAVVEAAEDAYKNFGEQHQVELLQKAV